MDYPAYDPKSAITPLNEAELAGLDEMLQSLPADGAMTLDGMDGYLTALLVGPPALLRDLKTADWLPGIWGGDPEPGTAAPFASNQKKKRTTVLVLRHLRSLAATLESNPDAWEPVFSVADVPGEDGRELADAGDWCLGFLAATDLLPEAWAPLFDDPEVGPGLATIVLLAGEAPVPATVSADEDGDPIDQEEEDLEDPVIRDQLSRAAADAALALWARRARDTT
jgi:uncharacterized protein